MTDDQGTRDLSEDPTGGANPKFRDTSALPDHIEEELEVEEAMVPDSEEEVVEDEETEYTDPDV